MNKWQSEFLGTLSRTGCEAFSATCAGVRREAALRKRGRDPKFARRWRTALKEFVKTLPPEDAELWEKHNIDPPRKELEDG